MPKQRGSAGSLRADPIITMNEDGVVQSASDAVEQVFGWTPSELFGRNLNVLIPEPRRSALDRYLDRYRHATRKTLLHRSRRFEAVRKDGRPIEIELSVSRADLPTQRSPFFVGIIRDVTGQIDVGDDAEKEQERLQQLITEQTRALATANLRLQLSDRLASLGTLAAGLGHDMNNVLLPIRARLNALEHAGVPASAARHLTAVRRSVAYLQHLSDGLHVLAFDPNSDSQDGEGSTDLAQWWSEVGTLLSKAIPSRIKLRISLAKTLPDVGIAPDWLTQAVLNLLVNAGEAIPARSRSPRITVSGRATPDGRAVRLSVTDNGRGMSAETQRRAFDLFFTTKTRKMGTGLGLPLARKVAVRAGGDIELVSAPERGTSVTLVLPVASSQAKGRRTRTSASVRVKDPRTHALVSQVLVGSGARLSPPREIQGEPAKLLVTEPTPENLSLARRWRKGRAEGPLFLIGAPHPSTLSEWMALGAVQVDPLRDLDVIRRAVGSGSRRRPATRQQKEKAA